MNDQWDTADDADWDDEGYEDESWDDDDAEQTLPCPRCGEEVFEDSPRCPACGDYIDWSQAYDQASGGWRVVYRWTAVVLVVALLVPFLINVWTLLSSLIDRSK